MKADFGILVLGTALLVSSCGPIGGNNDPEPQDCNPFPAVNELLMGKQWVEVAETTITVSGNDSIARNSYPDMAPCSQDDFMEFQPKGVLVQDNGPNKCVPFMPQSLKGTWCTSNAGKTLTLTYGNQSGELEIISLGPQQMILRETRHNSPKSGQTELLISTHEPR